eukprot:CAMPEP_0119507898 /NCGR_PEP_ID=MMETSP1344-20130328/27663_1 /TAXON_ID=236787 /ORGANISM="Florenciella parvula, Strain CCMP2471" /LENGTH=75 /DNA_ID=CAMNT_0007544571 /DNA_START=53 /DNA_END=276 /DNA_ORIENTATION=+
MSDMEFKLRPSSLGFGGLLFTSVLFMDLGHLFKDTESFVLAWGTSGLWVTTADAITNTTATGDAPWDVTRHTYVR